MVIQEVLSFSEFAKRYNNGETCYKQLFEMRWPKGFACPRCGNGEYYYIKTRGLFQCGECQYQGSVTAGTIFHKTRIPLVKWFWVIYLVYNNQIAYSLPPLPGYLNISTMSEQINVSYTCSWTMFHKVRRAMNDHDANCKLSELIKINEACLGTLDADKPLGESSRPTQA